MSLLAVALFTLGMVSCSDDNNDYMAPTPSGSTTFKATLNGSSEVPPNISTATGSAELVFNKTTKVFTITVIYNTLTPTGGHIHAGTPTTLNGPIAFPFPEDRLASPIIYTSRALSAAEEENLFKNGYYVNLHTVAYGAGEIRGQLIKQTTGY